MVKLKHLLILYHNFFLLHIQINKTEDVHVRSLIAV